MNIKDTVTALLNKPKVQKWLEEKEPKKIVGETCSEDNCPLANYFQSRGYYSVVSHEKVVLSESEEDYQNDSILAELTLPHWAAKFVDDVDNTGVNGGVTFLDAKIALELLEESR
ncbi:hypothetical protein [Spirulina sp. 06S082]|uniref:hypothetical protein n=1 Tax=Spirulina sp. 06S082 TaxID=3110248 RepID=UPI002B21D8BF|nr:hypothetical protein [Spirulina sp. 06S082]MEA5468000.1 hypothetical protein [Spirulina sp. 06S082]